MLTEQSNPQSENIDQLSSVDILHIMNDEDAAVINVVRAALPSIARAVDLVVAALSAGGRLIYVGAGTSGRLGVLDAVECVPTFGVPPGLIIGIIAGGTNALTNAIEGAEDHLEDGQRDLEAINLTSSDTVVGIAASGHTPYVLGAIQYASRVGTETVGIACNQPSPLLEVVNIAIGLPVGAEVIAGSTRLKAGTAQKMVLNMLSTAAMVKLGKVYGNQMVDVLITNDKLARRAERIVSELANVPLDEAKQLLLRANNSVKTAIVMHLKQITPEAAARLLKEAGGNLRTIIG